MPPAWSPRRSRSIVRQVPRSERRVGIASRQAIDNAFSCDLRVWQTGTDEGKMWRLCTSSFLLELLGLDCASHVARRTSRSTITTGPSPRRSRTCRWARRGRAGARRTGSRAASATVRGPLWPFKSVAVYPRHAKFTLTGVPSSSWASAARPKPARTLKARPVRVISLTLTNS